MKAVDSWLRQQSICVTGGRGALGKRLVQRLLVGGAQRVVTLDSHPDVPEGEVMPGRCAEHLVGSILNPADLDRALGGCTVVFHLAALIHVGRSRSEPLRYFEVNAFGTACVLEACRRLGVRQVVYTSTSHVYGIPRQLPIGEDHPTVPLSVYAASKLAGEAAVQGYSASFRLSGDVARLANLYGASFNPETVIGRALEQAAVGGPVCLRNLASVRDFIHADDVVEALVRIAAASGEDTGCHIVNVSTGQGVSVREVVETLSKIVVEQELAQPELIQTGDSRDELVPRLILDNRRLSELTGWAPQISLEQGLRLLWQEYQQEKK